MRPTFTAGDAEPRLEVHLLDFDQDLYGSTLEVAFAAHLRGEQRFDGPEELAAQIARDVAAARAALAT